MKNTQTIASSDESADNGVILFLIASTIVLLVVQFYLLDQDPPIYIHSCEQRVALGKQPLTRAEFGNLHLTLATVNHERRTDGKPSISVKQLCSGDY